MGLERKDRERKPATVQIMTERPKVTGDMDGIDKKKMIREGIWDR